MQHVTFKYDGELLDINAFVSIASDEAARLRQTIISIIKGTECCRTHYVCIGVHHGNAVAFIQDTISKYASIPGKRMILEGEVAAIKPPQTNEVSVVLNAATSKPEYWTWNATTNTVKRNTAQPSVVTRAQLPAPAPLLQATATAQVMEIVRQASVITTMTSKCTQTDRFDKHPQFPLTNKANMSLNRFKFNQGDFDKLKDSYRRQYDRIQKSELIVEDLEFQVQDARAYERKLIGLNANADLVMAGNRIAALEGMLRTSQAENAKWREDSVLYAIERLARNPELLKTIGYDPKKTYTTRDYRDLIMLISTQVAPSEMIDHLQKENAALKATSARKLEEATLSVQAHIRHLEARNAELEGGMQTDAEENARLVVELGKKLADAEERAEKWHSAWEQCRGAEIEEAKFRAEHEAKVSEVFNRFLNAKKEALSFELNGELFLGLERIAQGSHHFKSAMIHPLTEMGRSYQSLLNAKELQKFEQLRASSAKLSEELAAQKQLAKDATAKLMDAEATIRTKQRTINVFYAERMRNGWSAPMTPPEYGASTEAAIMCNGLKDMHTLVLAARTELDAEFKQCWAWRDMHNRVRVTASFIKTEKATYYSQGQNNDALRSLNTALSKLEPPPPLK